MASTTQETRAAGATLGMRCLTKIEYENCLSGGKELSSWTRVEGMALKWWRGTQVAFFVCRFPVGIGFASLKPNGLVANGTTREPHLGRDAHNAVQLGRRRSRAKMCDIGKTPRAARAGKTASSNCRDR